jgi:hypothetical protein
MTRCPNGYLGANAAPSHTVLCSTGVDQLAPTSDQTNDVGDAPCSPAVERPATGDEAGRNRGSLSDSTIPRTTPDRGRRRMLRLHRVKVQPLHTATVSTVLSGEPTTSHIGRSTTLSRGGRCVAVRRAALGDAPKAGGVARCGGY